MYAKKVLFATLNWGLGHTTRSIPIIKELQSRGYEIIIASDGIAGLVLQREFPLLPYFELPSYQITYSPHSFYYHWIQQLPKLRQAISIEHKRIAEIVSSNQVDVVISDNRYGVYHPTTKNIFITHQLSFALPFPINKLLSHQIRVMVNRFDQCWIPDYPTQDNLTGLLSTGKIAIEKVFIGPISRFKPQEGERKFDLGVIISGPEPLRTTLQNELLAKLDQTWKTFWVLGKPGANASNEAQNQYAHLNTDDLNLLINQTEVLVSRSGYTSIMDYHVLAKKAVLIPTPYQPEQLYLAQRHKDKPGFFLPDRTLSNLNEGILRLYETKVNQKPSGFLLDLPHI